MMPEDDERPELQSTIEWKVQIVLLAAIVTIFGSVGFVLLPLLFTEKDPVISLAFAGLLALTSMMLGGSLVYGWVKVKVGAEARRYAEEMLENALSGGGEGALEDQRRYYEDLLVKEREKFIDDLEHEKQAYAERLREELQAKYDGQENAYVEELKAEFERRVEKEKQDYVEKVNRDFGRQLEEEKRAYGDALKAELERRLDGEKKAYAEKISCEVGGRVEEERKAVAERLAVEYERKVEEEKRRYGQDLKAEFDKRIEAERKAYMDIVRKDFEEWKKEFSEDFRREMMRDVKPQPAPRPEPPKPEPRPAPEPFPFEEALSYSKPQDSQGKEVKESDFLSMDTEQKLTAAVELLQGGKAAGTMVVFYNTKTRRHMGLRGKGHREVVFDTNVEEVSIKSRLKLREYCAQNRLPMDKTDDYIRILLGNDAGDVYRNLKEIFPIAYAATLENLTFEVKLEPVAKR
jgi:hypothetical protein